jgi:hypothetical protein
MRWLPILSAVPVLAVVAVLAGCGPSGTAGPSPEVLAVLAKADALDGASDKTVKKCFGCNLGMDGKPDMAVKVGEYQAWLCSEHCRHTFEADPAKAILAAKFPDAGKK